MNMGYNLSRGNSARLHDDRRKCRKSKSSENKARKIAVSIYKLQADRVPRNLYVFLSECGHIKPIIAFSIYRTLPLFRKLAHLKETRHPWKEALEPASKERTFASSNEQMSI